MYLDEMDALFAFQSDGTVAAAATRLRLTQSAVSKRLAAIEERAGRTLLERRGRRLVLTSDGMDFITRARPLVEQLRAVFRETSTTRASKSVLGVSESVLSSWGAPLLARVEKALEPLSLELHTHRSPVTIDRVRAGEYDAALTAGVARGDRDLIVVHSIVEPMVIVPRSLARYRARNDIPIISIETHSETWRSISARARALGIKSARTVESFVCAAQMARAGFGHALVPWGVAQALGLEGADVHRPRDLGRPVSLVTRKSTFHRAGLAPFFEEVKAGLNEVQVRLARWK